MKKKACGRGKTREDYLNNSADLLCRAAFELCESSFGRKARGESDFKSLKDACAAVKEVMAIASGLEETSADGGQAIKIYMSEEAQGYAV